MNGPALIVPIELDALIVTAAEAEAEKPSFRRWRFAYGELAKFGSPEPEAGQGEESAENPAAGVHLHWSLPEALRHGAPTRPGGPVEFPLVPNRWLVVRLGGAGAARVASGWIVESDCPEPESTALYLLEPEILEAWLKGSDKLRATVAEEMKEESPDGPWVAHLGRAFPLAGGWSERAAAPAFLTATAPGNAAFAAYHPHSAEVFGFHDPLDGIDAEKLSYMVAGWHSSPGDDILARASMADLGWTVAAEPKAAPSFGVYHGIALDVPWEREATTPPPSPLDSLAGKVHVGLGPTVTDAFTALVRDQMLSSGRSAEAAETRLLQAFQYGLLPELEEIAGPELLRLATHREAFDSKPGGRRWVIVAAEESDSAPLPESPSWLTDLNRDQAELNAAQLALADLQSALYAVWWKLGRGARLARGIGGAPEGFEEAEYEKAVAELSRRVGEAEEAVEALLPRVPQPIRREGLTEGEAFELGVARFAAGKGLAPGLVLKALAAPRLWRRGDPALVLSGVEPAPAPDPDTLLACRLGGEIVSAFAGVQPPVDVPALGKSLPALEIPIDAPPPLAALVAELFLLDPGSATAIAAAAKADAGAVANEIEAHAPASYKGTLPALDLHPWKEQPWAPLMMEWQVGYVHIPYRSDGAENWSFDGCDYLYSGPFGHFKEESKPPPRSIGGISLLTGEAQFNFATRLKEFIDVYVRPSKDPPLELAELETLYGAVESLDEWRFMSQRLTGLGDQISLRDTRAQTGPDPDTARLIGGQTGSVPLIPEEEGATFEGVEMGQFAIESLIVYDRFGQVLAVVGGTGADPTTFEPSLDEALAPDHPVIAKNSKRLAELRPRVLQHGRLDFDLLDAGSGKPYRGPPATNPIGGWLLPNHLDGSISLYAPGGAPLGELGLREGIRGGKTVHWEAPPDSDLKLSELEAQAPLLAGMAGAGALDDPVAFETLLEAIDSTLWSIDPLGDRADQNLSVLIGRPLALVRARLALSLDGEPVADMSDWKTTWPPPAPDFTDFDFQVRLGDAAVRRDGLIGYFADGSYERFNSVQAPDPDVKQSYVSQIGPVGKVGGGNYPSLRFGGPAKELALLVDPRASVHAISGILPAKELTLPPELVGTPLATLAVAFRAGPLLTPLRPPPGDGGGTPPPGPKAISMPLPSERNGSWEWWEEGPAAASGNPTWTRREIVQSSPDAQLQTLPSTLREGFLQLRLDLDEATPENQGGEG